MAADDGGISKAPTRAPGHTSGDVTNGSPRGGKFRSCAASRPRAEPSESSTAPSGTIPAGKTCWENTAEQAGRIERAGGVENPEGRHTPSRILRGRPDIERETPGAHDVPPAMVGIGLVLISKAAAPTRSGESDAGDAPGREG